MIMLQENVNPLIITTMKITLSDDLVRLLAAENKLQDLDKGKSHLSVGVHEILLYEDNMSKITVIKDGTIKQLI